MCNTLQVRASTYKKMLTKPSLHIVRDFLHTEKHFLKTTLPILTHYKKVTVVVVGCGNLSYLSLIKEIKCEYLGIDPYADCEDSPQIIKKTFEDYLLSRKDNENKIFIFWFNVIAHLDIAALQKSALFFEGDVLINSTWSTTQSSKDLLNKYYISILPPDQKAHFSPHYLLDRNRSVKCLLKPTSFFTSKTKKNNLFEVALL